MFKIIEFFHIYNLFRRIYYQTANNYAKNIHWANNVPFPWRLSSRKVDDLITTQRVNLLSKKDLKLNEMFQNIDLNLKV